MRLMFVHHVIEDRGSAQDMYSYTAVAKALGHEILLYGPANGRSPFRYSLKLDDADAVIFICEWTTELQYGGKLDLCRLVGHVPRQRRVVIDCDGKYNEAIRVTGDCNHSDVASSRRWMDVCDSLADKICQPTLHPLQPNVRPFFFHAYNPAWEVPLDARGKKYGLVYVGNNWFRWRSLQLVLRAVESVRERVGPLALVGNGWSAPAPWANPSLIEDAYYRDPAYLRKLDVEVKPAIRFDQVIESMGSGLISPVVYRPLFDHLRLVTCRTFETIAANTIPLFAQDEKYVEEIYGREAMELILPHEEPEEKILDIVQRPDYYAGIVAIIRRRLADKHSYAARLRELIRIVES